MTDDTRQMLEDMGLSHRIPEGTTITHFATRAQVDGLFDAFAKPVECDNRIEWRAPKWWHAMMRSAKG